MENIKEFFGGIKVLWSSFGVSDFFDIALVAFVLFCAFRFIRDRRAGKLIVGVIFLVVLQIIARSFGLITVNYVLGKVFEVGVIALIVLFQPELRSALEKVGTEPLKGIRRIGDRTSSLRTNELIESICVACCQMAKEKTGALIVIERKTRLGEHINSGTVINADPTPAMIENVFFKNAPLHDGALVVRGDRLYAAGCFLPLSGNEDFKELGTRHHAAVGVSEVSDAIVLVVSEQTGTISVAMEGKLRRNLDYVSLKNFLTGVLIGSEKSTERRKRKKNGKKSKNENGEPDILDVFTEKEN